MTCTSIDGGKLNTTAPRNSNRQKKLYVVLATLLLVITAQEPAGAFWVHNFYNPSYGAIEYEIDGSVAALGQDAWRAIHKADQAWGHNWQYDRFRIYDGADRRNLITASNFNGTVFANAAAHTNVVGCTPGNCTMDINTAYSWDVDDDPYLGAGRLDLWSTVVHEMGHWIGITHADNNNGTAWTNPSTYPYDPVMKPRIGFNEQRRTITQDDANAFWAARPDWQFNGVVANPSFDTDGPFYGWASRGNGWSECGPGTWHGACQHRLSGPPGSSVYQDMEPRGNVFYNGRPWWLTFRVKTSVTQTVTVALWSLNNGGSVNKTCTIVGNQVWQACQMGPVIAPGNDTRVRIELYKNGSADIATDVPIFAPA
jgi:hypothetical protein